MNKFEDKLKAGYESYLALPKEKRGLHSEMYSNGWCILTGRAIVSPHPHRHYTFLEFVYWCGKDETLYNRFLKAITE
jgi:hypothetical protein